MALTVGSLFSGIGGFDLGLQRAGMTITWQVEIDEYCRRVLERHWPSVPRYGDIRAVDWTTVEPVDLVCGGFPCQPVSCAGKRLAQADARWLWPEFARCLRALRPRYALIENVPGLFVSGFADVLADLAGLGFDAEWDVLSAADFGAPHLRKRVWIVADAASTGCERGRGFAESKGWETDDAQCGGQTLADADGGRQQEREEFDGATIQDAADWDTRRGHADGCDDAIPDADGEPLGRLAEPWEKCGHWATEPDVGRVAYGVSRRVDRLRGIGNAVVPQIVEWLGRRILMNIPEADAP